MTVMIPIEAVHELRCAAQHCLDVPDVVSTGWSIMPMDIDRVVDVFPSLALKPGYTLTGYLYYTDVGSHGVVWAVPVDTRLPHPRDWPDEQKAATLTNIHYKPPRPRAALANVMAAIDGDHTPESFFEASLLRRELDECGAFWHALEWTTEEILGSDPFADPSRRSELVVEGERRERLLRTYPEGYTPDWQWHESKPTTWPPMVRQSASGKSQVVFHTHCRRGQHRIIRHRDTFYNGSYRHESESVVIARGPVGRIF